MEKIYNDVIADLMGLGFANPNSLIVELENENLLDINDIKDGIKEIKNYRKENKTIEEIQKIIKYLEDAQIYCNKKLRAASTLLIIMACREI